MKTKSIFLCALAAAISLSAGASESEKTVATKPRIEVCFVLDTTGSMGGLIEGAKQKIWSMANEIIAAKPTPLVKFALVGYRDRGDEYVTKLTALTDDIDAVYADLQKFQAGGGGDTPESVSQALDEAVRKIAWSTDRSVLKIIYLVGDAPPHTDCADGPDYVKVCVEAVKRDLIINTVQCGDIPGTREVWAEIARRSEGQYVALAQTGNMMAVATPFDARMAELNREIGTTLVAYGSVSRRREVMSKQAASEGAAAPAAADRLAYNMASGGKSVQGEGELIDALDAGTIKLADIKREELPEELRGLSEAQLKTRLDETRRKRAALQKEIADLAKQREEFMVAERKRLAAAGKGDAFDEKVAETLRAEAAKKGISYK